MKAVCSAVVHREYQRGHDEPGSDPQALEMARRCGKNALDEKSNPYHIDAGEKNSCRCHPRARVAQQFTLSQLNIDLKRIPVN